jgi:hypothetical protein
LELDGGHPDTEVIDQEDVVHHLLTFSFEVDALGPKHTENGAIAHELVDHRLRDVADGFVPFSTLNSHALGSSMRYWMIHNDDGDQYRSRLDRHWELGRGNVHFHSEVDGTSLLSTALIAG